MSAGGYSDMVGRDRDETRTRPDCLTLDGERTSADQPSLPVHDGEGSDREEEWMGLRMFV
jgi:hypothetical protein